LKQCFHILLGISPEFPKEAQARLVPVLCCLHNFHRLNDGDGNFDWDPEMADNSDPFESFSESYTELEVQNELSVGDLVNGVTAEDVTAGDELQSSIAACMWDDYVDYLAENNV
jgi:hypothetical protein